MKIETDRLVLRNYKMTDLVYYVRLMSQEKVANRAGFSLKNDYRLAQNLKEETEKELTFAITLKGDDKVIGEIGLDYLSLGDRDVFGTDKNEAVREVKFCLSEEYWNKGYMSEAMEALVKFGFEEMSLDTIVGATYSKNMASKKVQIKSGLMPYKMAKKEYIWRETLETCKVVLLKITKEQYSKISRYKKLKIKVTDEKQSDKIFDEVRNIIESSKDVKEL